MDIHQFNIEIGVFLRRLRLYSKQESIKINEETVKLLVDAVDCIDKLIGNSEKISNTNHDNVNFLFDLNEQQFDLRQYIMCRLCVVSYDAIILYWLKYLFLYRKIKNTGTN